MTTPRRPRPDHGYAAITEARRARARAAAGPDGHVHDHRVTAFDEHGIPTRLACDCGSTATPG